MIYLNVEQMIREPLQDSELDLVVGGFAGTAVKGAIDSALGNREPNLPFTHKRLVFLGGKC
jgi:hypothetical protein